MIAVVVVVAVIVGEADEHGINFDFSLFVP